MNEEMKPASPLPFRVGKREKRREDLTLIDDDDNEVGDFAAIGLESQDWQYVAHAANEYPKLRAEVARLREALERVADGGEDATVDANGDLWVTNEETVERIGGYDRTEPVGVNISEAARKALEPKQ
jgi:hypothetical protein